MVPFLLVERKLFVSVEGKGRSIRRYEPGWKVLETISAYWKSWAANVAFLDALEHSLSDYPTNLVAANKKPPEGGF